MGFNINFYVLKVNFLENDYIVNLRFIIFDLLLIVVCYEGYLNVVWELIYNGVDVNKEDNFVIFLVVVCFKGYFGVIKLLLKLGFNKIVIFYVFYIGYIGEVLKLIRLGIDFSRDELGKKLIIVVCV